MRSNVQYPLGGITAPVISPRGFSLRRLLFTDGSQGFTFEPWDITTLYQDRAGTTPVTAAGQSVGLMLDKSKGLWLGPELVTNGDFSSNVAGWTAIGSASLSYQSGTMQISGTGTANPGATQSVTLTAGITYAIRVDYTVVNASGTIKVAIGSTGVDYGSATVSGGSTASATITAKPLSTGKTNIQIYIGEAAGATSTIRVDNISVREIAGNHEVAINDASRGIYGWMPKTWRRNLLTYSEQFGNAVWGKVNANVSADAAAPPSQSATADKIIATATSGQHTVESAIIMVAATVYTATVTAKADGIRYLTINSQGSANQGACFDLQTGALAIAAGPAVSAARLTSLGDGWYRLAMTFTNSFGRLSFAAHNTPSNGFLSYTGDGTSGILIWGAQLELGSTDTAYQRVVSNYDVTEAGVPSCYYVLANGVNTAYVTPTITPNADKVQVFAGVRKNSDAASGIVVETSAEYTTNPGAFVLAAPSSAGANSYRFGSNGAPAAPGANAGTGVFAAAPNTSVLTGLGSISGDIATLRRNGALVETNTTNQGTGNYLAYPAYIYARGGTTLPFNGYDFGHVVRFGPNLDAATIARVEALIARNTPEVTL